MNIPANAAIESCRFPTLPGWLVEVGSGSRVLKKTRAAFYMPAVAAWIFLLVTLPVLAVIGTDKPSAGVDWGAAQEVFDRLGKFGMPDTRGASLATAPSHRMGEDPRSSLGLTWFFPLQAEGLVKIIPDQISLLDARLSGRMWMMSRQVQRRPSIRVASVPVISFDGELCDVSQAVEMIQKRIARNKAEAQKGAESAPPSPFEVEAFLFGLNLQTAGNENAARQVLLLLNAKGGRLDQLAIASEATVLKSKTKALVREHFRQPDWDKLASSLRHFQNLASPAYADREALDALITQVESRGAGPFAADARYESLSDENRELLSNLASEPLGQSFVDDSLWVARPGMALPSRKLDPKSGIARLLGRGPASLPILAYGLGDQRPLLFTHALLMTPRNYAVQDRGAFPRLATMDELARRLLEKQVPNGEVSKAQDGSLETKELAQWCLRAARQDRFALAKRFLESGSDYPGHQIAHWLAVQEPGSEELKLFCEWLPRQSDEWLQLFGIGLLYSSVGKHGIALRPWFAQIKPRLLVNTPPVDVSKTLLGSERDLQAQAAALESMAQARSPVEGLIAALAQEKITAGQCRELRQVLNLHAPEANIRAVLASLGSFKRTNDIEWLFGQLCFSGGGDEGDENEALERLRSPLSCEGLEELWLEAMKDERELLEGAPQFSATVGQIAARACLRIHGAYGPLQRFGECSSFSGPDERHVEITQAQALLRGEVPLRQPYEADGGGVLPDYIHEPQPPLAFLVGKLSGLPLHQRGTAVATFPIKDRLAIRQFLAAPRPEQDLSHQIPSNIRSELCTGARTLRVVPPTSQNHPLRKLDGREISDETREELLRACLCALENGQPEVITLRLNDTLDGIHVAAKPLDLRVLAHELFHADKSSNWANQWMMQSNPISAEVESLPDSRRRLLISAALLPDMNSLVLRCPVGLSQEQLQKWLIPRAEPKDSVHGFSSFSHLLRNGGNHTGSESAGFALWRNLRALLIESPAPQKPSENATPSPPSCEGLIFWCFDLGHMRKALQAP